ncbi:MAG: SpoIID/LytB domain-containing protein [bacterium]
MKDFKFLFFIFIILTIYFNHLYSLKLTRPKCAYLNDTKDIIPDNFKSIFLNNLNLDAELNDLSSTNTIFTNYNNLNLAYNETSTLLTDIKPTLTIETFDTINDNEKIIEYSQPKIIKNKIRVLLDEINSKEPNNFFIQSKEGVIIQTLPKTTSPILLKNKKVYIKVKDDSLYLSNDGQEYKKAKKKEILIKPVKKYFSFNGKSFNGEVKLLIDEKQNKLFIINNLNLEDYIYSVLRFESYPTWPKDMQKIQAIASRSYAFHCMRQARIKKIKNPYDIKRSNHHQTYNGKHDAKHLKEAVKETTGVILTYDKKPIIAMFDACCGGVIPANMKNPDFKKAPYLAREERCVFCKNYTLYHWKKDLLFNSFVNNLKNNPKISDQINKIGKIYDIKIAEKDKAGVVHKIKFIGSKKNSIVNGRDFWENQRKTIRSLNFDLKKINDRLIITGNGFGHQIGLCQRGARELLNRGWNYKNILKFYYPKTQIAKLKYS